MFKVEISKKPSKIKKPIPLNIHKNIISPNGDYSSVTAVSPKATNTTTQPISTVDAGQSDTGILFEIY